MDFSDLPIHRTDITDDELNIVDKTGKSLFSWNGQFSPQFVESILSKYASTSDSCLDPFAGSGTLLIECARRGISCCGVELNPSAYHMAKAYEYCNVGLNVRGLAFHFCRRGGFRHRSPDKHKSGYSILANIFLAA